MRGPFLFLLAVSFCFVVAVDFPWECSQGSWAFAAAASASADYARAAQSAGGLPWWTTNFLQGHSLSFMSYSALTTAGLGAGMLVAGLHVGSKLAALAFLLLCPLTMYAFVRRLCRASGWPAFACGCLYLFSPAILLRLGFVEHLSVLLAFAALPLAFLGVLCFLEERTVPSAVFCAVANAVLVLAYVKIAVLTLPMLCGFAVWAWSARGRFEIPPVRALAACLGIFGLLAILPNLPALRETQFIAGFDFGPLAGWQRAFSSETALSWLDRGGWLSGAPGSSQSPIRTTGSYLGIVGFAFVVLFFFFRRHPLWQTSEASVIRLFLALTLLAQWLGFGVNTPLTGQMAFLAHSENAQDFAIALSWGLLILQAVAIALILPGSLPAKPWFAAAAITVYLCVPGFRLIEKLPFFGGIRAPQDFFQIPGAFCFVVAAGLSAWILLSRIRVRTLRTGAIAFALLLAPVDSALCVDSFFRGPMEQAVHEDFLKAQDFLRTSKIPGRVYPFSGRYFYLLTPQLSGRPLTTEAFLSYLTPRGMARLHAAASHSAITLQALMDVTGSSFLLIDRTDPDTPASVATNLKSLFPTAYENAHFLILENPSSLAPAFFAGDARTLTSSGEEAAIEALDLAADGIAAFEKEDLNNVFSTDSRKDQSQFQKIDTANFRRDSDESIHVTPPAKKGWLILPESWHPDWTAIQSDNPLPIARALCGLLAIQLNGSPAPILIRFQPPAWFPIVVWTSLVAWAAAVVFLLIRGWQFLLVKDGIRCAEPGGAVMIPPSDGTAPATKDVTRPLVIIPTFNEAGGISKILDRTLEVEPTVEILIVDDGSPDGTAGLVRSHPAFGGRIHLIERAGKLGLGSAYREGFQWAADHHFDACLEMDADFSHDPADIPRLLEALRSGADAAIASRYLDGVRVLNWPQDRLLLSMGASRFVRALTRLPLTDVTSGFKALRVSALERLDWKNFRAEGYGFQVELHFFLWKSGARLAEVPITFTERREGKTKMTPGIALEALRRVLELAFWEKNLGEAKASPKLNRCSEEDRKTNG